MSAGLPRAHGTAWALVAAAVVTIGVGAAWALRPPPDPAVARADDASPAKRLKSLRKRFFEVTKRGNEAADVKRDVKRFLDRHGDRAGAWKLLGQIHLYAEERKKAYRALVRSLELKSPQPETALLAGSVAYERGAYEAAARHYRTALDHAPGKARYWQHLARAERRLGELEAAKRHLRKALDLDSSAWKAHVTLARICEAQGRPDAAVGHLGSAIERLPVAQEEKRVELVVRRARLLRQAGRPSEALQVLDDVPGPKRDSDRVLAAEAACWAALDRPEKAATRYEKAFKAHPKRADLLAAAARWRARAGALEQARGQLRMARRLGAPEKAIAEARAALRAADTAGGP